MKVLITGGAGFIGTHLARRLLREGHAVSILDNFSPQIHGTNQSLAPDLAPHVALHVGDVRDANVFARALQLQDAVVHLAAETGTGQSMYEVVRYQDANVGGAAVLLDYLVNCKTHRVRRLVTASSRAIYGEGSYRCAGHGIVYPPLRAVADMEAGRFNPLCPSCGCDMLSEPTPEEAPLQPTSFYGLTKQMQEQMTLMFGQALGIAAYALRFQNVYGPGQSLTNPYTGILAIFATQARKNLPIYIFEDGEESRDFVYIDDVVDAISRCLACDDDGAVALNVGSGERTTVKKVVEEITAFFGSSSEISVTGAFRQGDIRHNLADLSRVRARIGYEPVWQFEEGVQRFLEWAAGQECAATKYESSLQEM
ncbi:MAG TPA: NAD-dependent epimerase/dehydratase family protein, partial [Bryobacteraceae bacterium]|nr:NAD-dependent epimerase/dehydratase family protein [Bryobacteraceae bacterium]